MSGLAVGSGGYHKLKRSKMREAATSIVPKLHVVLSKAGVGVITTNEGYMTITGIGSELVAEKEKVSGLMGSGLLSSRWD